MTYELVYKRVVIYFGLNKLVINRSDLDLDLKFNWLGKLLCSLRIHRIINTSSRGGYFRYLSCVPKLRLES